VFCVSDSGGEEEKVNDEERTAFGTDTELSGVDNLGAIDDRLIHSLDGGGEGRHYNHLR
jgi:hypothetical protein